MERLYKWLLLKAIRGLGEVSIKKLWLNFGSVENIFSAGPHQLEQLLGEERASSIRKKDLTFDPELVVKTIEKEGIGWLTLEDKDYPPLLREIEDPPPVLFIQGDLRAFPLIALVGTRKPDPVSLRFINSLVRDVVPMGYGIVSGGAYGCDYQAHSQCLQFSGYTVCVLGMGLLRIPSYLQKLAGERTLFLSEFLPDANPDNFTFPRRNRLISGLARAVVIAEAGEKSGALITADYAVRQKRPLWVYIGNSTSPRWLGCVRLVNEGKAKILFSPSALVEAFPASTEDREPLLELLSTPKTFDELLSTTNLDPETLILRLSTLELEGKITRLGYHYVCL